MEQLILGTTKELDDYLISTGKKKILLVCDQAISFLSLDAYFRDLPSRLGLSVIRFSDFEPNPRYESVEKGVAVFNKEQCDLIIAVGGGSGMDVAKCIKLYAFLDPTVSYLKQTIVPNDIPFIAVPTTAGTGSEATRYAVIYAHGEKQSITHESVIPEAVLLDPSVLTTLPEYQRKSTMLDALCHAVESTWSVHSTDESQEYSLSAIRQILQYKDAYLANRPDGNQGMLLAANQAGKAINITQTTAGHAMCYKLTSLYHIAHGHAAALCVSRLFPYMLDHLEDCIDPRGVGHLEKSFEKIAAAFGAGSPKEAAVLFDGIVDSLGLAVPVPAEEDWEILSHSVNPVRLKNHPIRLGEGEIDRLYHQILSGKKEK